VVTLGLEITLRAIGRFRSSVGINVLSKYNVSMRDYIDTTPANDEFWGGVERWADEPIDYTAEEDEILSTVA